MNTRPWKELLDMTLQALETISQLSPERRVEAGFTIPDGGGIEDQLDAAVRDTETMMAKQRTLAPLVGLRYGETTGSLHKRAMLMASIARCTPCSHIVSQPIQPWVIDWNRRKVLCRSCESAPRTKAAVPEDQCDLCDNRPVDIFRPVLIATGPQTYMGNVCDDCWVNLQADGDED